MNNAGVKPKSTASASVKPDPVIVTGVPPTNGPADGLMPATICPASAGCRGEPRAGWTNTGIESSTAASARLIRPGRRLSKFRRSSTTAGSSGRNRDDIGRVRRMVRRPGRNDDDGRRRGTSPGGCRRCCRRAVDRGGGGLSGCSGGDGGGLSQADVVWRHGPAGGSRQSGQVQRRQRRRRKPLPDQQPGGRGQARAGGEQIKSCNGVGTSLVAGGRRRAGPEKQHSRSRSALRNMTSAGRSVPAGRAEPV